jgi:trk system potassium uptake protein
MRIVIIGAGAVGFYLASRLSDEAQEVILVDSNPDKVQHAADNLDVLAILGNGANPAVLDEAGLARADLLMAVSGSEEANLLACLAASRAGVPVKVARVRNPEDHGPGSLLPGDAFGIDLMISPEHECAWEVFQLLATEAATDLVRFAGGQVQLMGIRLLPGAPVVGKSLSQLDRELKAHRFVAAALVRNGQTQIPTGSTVLEEGDKVFILSPSTEIKSLPPLAGYEPFRLRRVMIAGGSDEAVYLARHLKDHGVGCTILERDQDRSRELAGMLPGALVLKGDATDLELLQMEGVEGIDGFAALTDRDEVNMLVALLAKSCGARRVIPLIHKTDYMALVERVGLDAAVSPRISAANAILRYIRRGAVASVATVKGSQAEAMEGVIGPGSPLVGVHVRDLQLPGGAVLGALVRGRKVIMPRGRHRVEEGDHAIFFVLPEAVVAVGKLLE